MSKEEILKWFSSNAKYTFACKSYEWDLLNADPNFIYAPSAKNSERTFSVGDKIKYFMPSDSYLYGEFTIMAFMGDYTIWKDNRWGHLKITHIKRYADIYFDKEVKYSCVKI